MANFDDTIKVLDSSVGPSETFSGIDGRLIYQLVIDGTPLAPIKAFYQQQAPNLNIFFIKVSCDNWNGATLSLQCKTLHPDDDFYNTSDDFTQDELKVFVYK